MCLAVYFIIALERSDINYVVSFVCVKYQVNKTRQPARLELCEGVVPAIHAAICWLLAGLCFDIWMLLFTASWVPRGELTPINEK
jgi:hypothetical protein